jgi:flagellar biosynthesis anti-sigma factor FlgM
MQLAKVEPQGLMSQGIPATAPPAKNPKLERSAHDFEASLMTELLKPLQEGDGLTGEASDGSGAGSEGALSGFASESLARAISERGDSGSPTASFINLNPSTLGPKKGRRAPPCSRASRFPDRRRYSLRGGPSMEVRDRSTYTSSLETLGIEPPSRVPPDGPSSSSVSGKVSGQDSSDLSPAAQVVAQAMQMPEVRQDRVASLQQQIASGVYQVAPQQVADAMLRNLAG